tara:strand:- start:235 stop:513 length:279 start_codon:yes stop_codon:yes gene_type:complete
MSYFTKNESKFERQANLKNYNVYSNLSVIEHDQVSEGEKLVRKGELYCFLIGASREVLYQAELDGENRPELTDYWKGQADALERLADQINYL